MPKPSHLKFTNLKTGLSHKEAFTLQTKYGFNTIEQKEKKNLLIIFLAEFKDLMIILLIIAAVIAIINNELVDGIVILAIVMLNAVISFVQQYRAEKALEALQNLVSPHAKVIREGKPQLISAKDVVPGDILIVESGDRIAADSIVVENSNLYTQESTLTGESQPIEKTEYHQSSNDTPLPRQMVFMGTEVSNGFAKVQVVNIGTRTKFGRIADLTQTTKKVESPLQREIKRIGIFVTKITLGITVVLFFIGYLIQGKELVDTLLFATSVAVAAVPEGLPATITIALALGVQRLAKKKAIVKQLASAETLGSTSCIITDKTGTLTRNEMTAILIITPENQYEITGNGYAPTGQITCNSQPATANQHLRLIKLAGQFCNTTLLNKKKNKYEVIGDPTEAAIIVLHQKLNFIELEKYKVTKTNPFDSERKRMSVQISDKTQYLLVKGAPEFVLQQCTSYITSDGKKHKLTEQIKKEILTANSKMADQALRVIAVAFHERPNDTTETNLTYVGLIGIVDPPRKEVKAVIQKAKQAGIQIIVATGDNGHTAKAIALQLDIITPNAIIKTHEDIKDMNLYDLQQLLKNNTDILFARVTPEDKLRLVQAQQANGQVVAVTGDGVNDAPALKQADIGVAMGIAGTDVSKEAANMILANDKFTTIINAIQEGRNVYINLKKIIFYLFSSNIGEIITIFLAILLNLPAPLTAILILLINVGTDSLPAIALSVDTSDHDLLTVPPRPKETRILEKEYLIHVISIGLVIGLITIGTFVSVLYSNGWHWGNPITDQLHTKAITAAFVSLILVQFFNAFNASSLGSSILKINLWKKELLLLSTIATLPLVFAITELPLFQKIFSITSLSPQLWLTIFLFAFSVIIIDELYKLIIKPKNA